MDIGYFNYDNGEQHFSPTGAKYNYQKLVNTYGKEKITRNNNLDPYGGDEHAIRALNDHLAPIAQKFHAKFYSQDDIKTVLAKRYFGSDSVPNTKRFTEPEKYAMYENDYNAICYGDLGKNINKDDPRLQFDDDDWDDYDEKIKQENKVIVNTHMEKLISDIDMGDTDAVLISFDPYTYEASIKSELDSATERAVLSAINNAGASRELFFYAYQNSSGMNSLAVNKMRAYHSIFNFSGYRLNNLNLKNGNFCTEDGENIIDVIKKNVAENKLIPEDFREDVYDNLKDSLDSLARYGYNNTPDLDLSIIYSKKDGFILTGGNYSV